MAKGFKHGAGGVSALNFNVVGGTSQPVNPKENTIWVNTDTGISGWVFSAEEPGEPAEGRVWINVGFDSSAPFNALKKNAVMVYPVTAKQYENGAWSTVDVKIYNGGEFVELINVNNYFYYHGKFFNGQKLNTTDMLNATYTEEPDCLSFVMPAKSSSYIYKHFDPVDLTGKKTITVKFRANKTWNMTGTNEWNFGFGFFVQKNTGNDWSAPGQRIKKVDAGNEYTLTSDVSKLSGEYYILIKLTNSNYGAEFDADVFTVEVI